MVFCVLWFLFLILPVFDASSQDETVLFREEFNGLDHWKPLHFPKIERHSTYTIEKKEGDSYLRAESDASASAMVHDTSFDVYDYPKVRWRWKVENVYEKWKPEAKSGDDYTIRVYVMFEFDPEKAGFFERLRYSFAKSIYGEYPPHSTLNYVWASRAYPERIITSPYTEKAKLILLRKGLENVGAWREEEVNIIEDYERAFGTKPPPKARIAVMNDSDNTGEKSVSYIDYIEVYR